MPVKNQAFQVKKKNKQYLRELTALISYETNVVLPTMCSYLFIS